MAQLLRADLLPEAWIAPAQVRQLRALLRHRAGLVRLRTRLQNRIHAVVADFGYDRSGSYLTGPGRGWLAGLELPAISREIVTDALAVIDSLAVLTERIDGELRQHAKADPRVKVLTTLPGVGQFTALVMLAEIGDITRFPSARKLASWAGLALRPAPPPEPAAARAPRPPPPVPGPDRPPAPARPSTPHRRTGPPPAGRSTAGQPGLAHPARPGHRHHRDPSSRPATSRSGSSRPTKLVSATGKPCTPAIPAAATPAPAPRLFSGGNCSASPAAAS